MGSFVAATNSNFWNAKTRMPRTKFYWAVLWLKTGSPARARQSRGRGLDLGRIHRDETPALILLARMLRKWCQCALHIVKRTAVFILILHGALGTFQSLLYMLCFLFPMDTTQVGKGCYPLVSISKPKFRTSQQFSHSPSLGSRGDE